MPSDRPGLLQRLLNVLRRGGVPSGPAPLDAADLRAAMAGWIGAHRREAWRPTVEDVEGSPAASRFGGRPWLAPGEGWPACPSCGRPLVPFLQLDLVALPGGIDRHGRGLLQLLYCVEEGCTGEAWAPSGGGKLVRVVDPGAGHGALPDAPPGVALMPARAVTGWAALEDWPGWAEHDEQGLEVRWPRGGGPIRLRWQGCAEAVTTTGEALEAAAPNATGDKLGGWPAWVQGVEYPGCPRCGAPMELLFQLDSEDHLPWMFGDTGCGHVTRCPVHRDQVAFAWACC